MKSRMALLLLAAGCGASARVSGETTSGRGPTASSEPPSPQAAHTVEVAPDAASPPAAHTVEATTVPAPAAAQLRPGDTSGSVLIGEIAAPKTFNPAPTLAALVPDLLTCYRGVRATIPSLRGKLKLRVTVSEVGIPQNVAAELGGSANNPALVSCLGDALKGATFPKPPGTAIIVVPLVFRP